MPHRRHRVRVHVHNRYVRAQSPQQNNRCKKRCRKGSRCRRGTTDQYQLDDDCDRPSRPCAGQDVRLGQRFHSAEEVCRRGCGGGTRKRDSRPCGEVGNGRYGGQGSEMENGGCNRCKRDRTQAGGSRPGTPCERFKSAEETCRGCPRRPRQEEYRRDQDAGRPRTSYDVYTAQVQQNGFPGGTRSVRLRPGSSGTLQPVVPINGQSKAAPACPGPAEITEEIVHTREHRWHIPSAQWPAARDRGEPGGTGPVRRGTDGNDPPPDCRQGAERRGSGSSDGLQRPAERSRPAAPAGQSSSDSGRHRTTVVAGVRRTRSEMLAGREMVARIARQVELDDGTRAQHQLVYRLSAQYGLQFGDSGSGSDSAQRPAVSDPGTEQTSQTTRTAQTVLRLERLQLEASSDTASSSEGAPPAGSGSPRPAPRSARPAEPPSPLPRRQVASEPTLPAPLGPATRATRSLDCQPAPAGGGARTKKLRTRGALTRLRQRSVTRLNEERQRQLLTEQLVANTDHQTAGKPSSNRSSDGEDSGRRDVTVLHAQNLLPENYQAPGSRGDAAAAEPIYQNIDTPYNGVKPGGSPQYNGGGGLSSNQPAPQSPYFSRADQPGSPQYANVGDYRDYGAARSPYLDTSPVGRSARATFDDDDQLGAALYEQRYQPRRDNSPYLSRPTGRAAAAPGTDLRAGAGAAQTGAPLQRQGGQQRLGGRRGVGIGQRLSRSFSSLRQRGAALYSRLSTGRTQAGAAGRGRDRGRAPAARPGGGGGARRRQSGGADSCSCTDTDSDCGAVNCSFLFYFNGDGGPSSFMCNMPAAITGAGGSQRGAGAMSKKYCGMCD